MNRLLFLLLVLFSLSSLADSRPDYLPAFSLQGGTVLYDRSESSDPVRVHYDYSTPVSLKEETLVYSLETIHNEEYKENCPYNIEYTKVLVPEGDKMRVLYLRGDDTNLQPSRICDPD